MFEATFDILAQTFFKENYHNYLQKIRTLYKILHPVIRRRVSTHMQYSSS